MNNLFPAETKVAYDVRSVITRVLDYQDFLEIQPGFAPNIVIGFGRLQGRPVGIVANQPCVLAGALDINASDKAARFVRFCNAFNIPLLTFVDVPGFPARSGAGVRRHHSPRRQDAVCLLGGDRSEDHGGGAQGLRRRVPRDVLQGSGRGPRGGLAHGGDRGDGRRGRGGDRLSPRNRCGAKDKAARRKELIEQYRETFANPYVAAGRRLVDDIIEPSETRAYLAQALESLHAKRELRPPKKHGLIPL